MARKRVSQAEIQEFWAAVEALRDKLMRIAMSSKHGGALYPHTLVDAAQNVPFLNAYSVLCDALTLRAERQDFAFEFRNGYQMLGNLFKAAKGLDWGKHRDLLEEGLKLRNKVAHQGTVLGRAECWKYIKAIGEVLRHWRLVAPLPAIRNVSPPRP